MEDLQLFKKLEINSQVHPYKVFFTKKINESLKDDLLVGDIIILDKNIYKLYPQIFDNINNKLILIEASACNWASTIVVFPFVNDALIVSDK